MESAKTEANSADRIIFWVNCSEVAKLSDRQLDEWKSRGVDGFVCVHQHLRGFGGQQHFDSRADAPLVGKSYELQRSLRDSRIVERAKERGMKLYLGFYLVNVENNSTPLLNWFDESGWKQKVLPAIRDITGAARRLGFDGISFDQELYGRGEAVQTWPWNYPGNTRPEKEVRAKVKQRGQEVMRTILDVFPRVELLTYAYSFDEDWRSVLQKEYNQIENYGTSSTFIDWYDGISSVEGYQAIRLFSTAFYKLHLPARDWELALAHEFNTVYSLFSRRLTNWSYAASRIHLSPAIWIDNGDSRAPDAYDSAKPPAYVDGQLQAMRRWGAGGELVVFAYHGLYGTPAGRYTDAFDYRPYESALKRASAPAVVDREPPSLSVTAPGSGEEIRTRANEIDLRGVADDNMALRVVRWKNDRGGGGSAQMDWRVVCGDYQTGYDSHTTWTMNKVPLQPGANEITVTAEDVKGMQVEKTMTIVSGGDTPTPDDTAPTIHLSSPRCNDVQSGRVMVTADAIDNVAVAKVEFLLDDAIMRTVVQPPYSWEWDTTMTAEGTKVLTAKAYDAAGRVSTASIPVVVQAPPSTFTIKRARAPATLDGRLSEYGSAGTATFGRPATSNSVTVRALWDQENLYLGYDVRDSQLTGSDLGRDGNVWEEDSVEWFVDVAGDRGGSERPNAPYMLLDDYQGIVNVANVQFDARGTAAHTPDPSWNGGWMSHVVTRGTVNADRDTDDGYVVEIRIPWTTLGLNRGPQENSAIGISFAVNDRDIGGSAAMMWPDVKTGFQNASKWQRVRLVDSDG